MERVMRLKKSKNLVAYTHTKRTFYSTKKVRNYLLTFKGSSCVRCNSKKDLHFHHVIANTKTNNVSNLIFIYRQRKDVVTWIELIKEVDKCILLCKSCHVELHQGKWQLSESVIRMYLKKFWSG